MTAGTVPGPEPVPAPVVRGPRRRGVLAATLLSPGGLTGAVVVATVVLAGVAAPLLAPHDPLAQLSGGDLLGPSGAYPLGTDEVGRDVLSRVLYGIREDLVVIALGVTVGAVLGTLLGLLSAASRPADVVVQRVFDVAFAFPGLIVGALLAAFLGPGRGTVVAVLVVANVPTFGRLARTEVVAQLTRDYVVAARTVGVSTPRLLLHHVLPNSVDAVVVQLALACGHAAFLEGGLSLVGFGIPPPTPSLGNLVDGSIPYLAGQPWYAIGPMVAVMALVIGSNLLADALNRALRRG